MEAGAAARRLVGWSPVEWLALGDDVRGVASRVADLLRRLPAGDVPVGRGTWSVREVGAHLVTVVHRYRRMLDGSQAFPASIAEQNAAEIEALGERRLDALADALEADVADLLEALGEDGDRKVHYFAADHTAAGVAGILLGELLLHGLDLARTASEPWPVTKDQALAVIRGVVPTLVWFVDPRVAPKAEGTYHLHVRPVDDWSIVVSGGKAVIGAGRPAGADLHLSVDPVLFLLNAYGLMPTWKAVARGGSIVWGRKPWLAGRLSRLFVET
jgi:uncharacterized protein (TIGR03083 family)